MNKISVIIPIYNVADYLPACLECVIAQTYKNLEIILVNDGSTDSCPQICEEFAANDDRIKVVHKINGGLSDARNAGFQVASGQFISYVDSDDLLSLVFYEKLLNALLENDADIAECDYIKFETEQDLINYNTALQPAEIYTTEKSLELLMNEQLKQVVWNKLYRKQVVAGIEFPIGKINEDEFWTYRVFGNAKKVVQIQDALYFYRQQTGSIMGKKYSLKRLDGLQALEERIGYMHENFPGLETMAIKYFCLGSTFHYQQLYGHPELDPDQNYRRNIIRKVRQYNRFPVLNKWHWKDVVWYKLFLQSPALYMKLRKYYEAKSKKLGLVNNTGNNN